MFIHSGITAGKSEADVHHVDGTVSEINNCINYCGDEILGAVPIFLLTPHENPMGERDDLLSV